MDHQTPIRTPDRAKLRTGANSGQPHSPYGNLLIIQELKIFEGLRLLTKSYSLTFIFIWSHDENRLHHHMTPSRGYVSDHMTYSIYIDMNGSYLNVSCEASDLA